MTFAPLQLQTEGVCLLAVPGMRCTQHGLGRQEPSIRHSRAAQGVRARGWEGLGLGEGDGGAWQIVGRTLKFSGKVPGSAHQIPSVSSSSRVPILLTSSAALCKFSGI